MNILWELVQEVPGLRIDIFKKHCLHVDLLDWPPHIPVIIRCLPDHPPPFHSGVRILWVLPLPLGRGHVAVLESLYFLLNNLISAGWLCFFRRNHPIFRIFPVDKGVNLGLTQQIGIELLRFLVDGVRGHWASFPFLLLLALDGPIVARSAVDCSLIFIAIYVGQESLVILRNIWNFRMRYFWQKFRCFSLLACFLLERAVDYLGLGLAHHARILVLRRLR